jgi:GTPase
LECDKITDFDDEIVRILRKSKKHVIVVGNKADNQKKISESYDMYSLGYEDVIFASVSHRI